MLGPPLLMNSKATCARYVFHTYVQDMNIFIHTVSMHLKMSINASQNMIFHSKHSLKQMLFNVVSNLSSYYAVYKTVVKLQD